MGPQFSSVQTLSHVRLFVTPWITARQASLSNTNSWSSHKLMCIESVMSSNHLILCHPLLLLPRVPPSIRFFSSESTFPLEVAKVLEFQPHHQSFQWTPRTGLLYDGLAGSLCSPRDSQENSSKASMLWSSTFFTVQLSHPYRTTGKTIALTKRTFVGKVLSLLFNMLSRLITTFLSRSKRLLISWLQSPSAVILEPRKIKSDTVSSFPIYFPWSDGTGCHDLRFRNVEF